MHYSQCFLLFKVHLTGVHVPHMKTAQGILLIMMYLYLYTFLIVVMYGSSDMKGSVDLCLDKKTTAQQENNWHMVTVVS